MERLWLIAGSLSGFLSVALGAFAAHGLKERLTPQLLTTFETGVRYQMYHALALVFVGLLASRCTGSAIKVAGFAFLLGTVLFSGSLYALSLTGIRVLGAITPFGGLSFLVGWLAFVAAAYNLNPSE